MAKQNHLYSQTTNKDFYLDLAVLPTATELGDTKTIGYHIVTPRQQYRPDLLSYDLYGDSSQWWTIALLNRNQIEDPIRDLKAGMTLRFISPTSFSGGI